MFTMLLDHIGLIYNIPFLRCIGRVSMPLYAYLIYKSHSKHINDKEYKRRLLYIGLLSQLQFMGMVYNAGRGIYFNICFTWYLCVVCLDNMDNNIRDVKTALCFGLSAFALMVLPLDYGIIAFLWVILWDSITNKNYMLSCAFGGVLVILSVANGDYVQLLSFVAVPVVLLIHKAGMNEYIKNKLGRKIYRYFYPLHLGVLSCLH